MMSWETAWAWVWIALSIATFFAGWAFGRPGAREMRSTRRCGTAFQGGQYRCTGLSDPRCDGGCCTLHCRELCRDRCKSLPDRALDALGKGA